MFDVNCVDSEAKVQGTWREFSGGSFKIAHMSSLSFQRHLNKLQQPYRKKIESGKIDPQISLEILCAAMSRHILLNWKGVVSAGKEIKYDETSAYSVLMSNDDLREFVQETSLDLDNYKQEAAVANAKS